MSSTIGNHIWTLTHHENLLLNKFLLDVQRSVYRLFIGVYGFLKNVQELTKGFHNVFIWIFSRTLPWLISSFLADSRLSFSTDMAKSSFLIWWTSSGTWFSFNILECSSMSGRYSSIFSFAKEAINFDVFYLYHLLSGNIMNLLISGSLLHESLSEAVLIAEEE